MFTMEKHTHKKELHKFHTCHIFFRPQKDSQFPQLEGKLTFVKAPSRPPGMAKIEAMEE